MKHLTHKNPYTVTQQEAENLVQKIMQKRIYDAEQAAKP